MCSSLRSQYVVSAPEVSQAHRFACFGQRLQALVSCFGGASAQYGLDQAFLGGETGAPLSNWFEESIESGDQLLLNLNFR